MGFQMGTSPRRGSVFRRAVEADEREFDLFVPRRCERGGFLGQKDAIDAVGVFFHQAQKAVFSGRFVVCNRRLDQMPRAVEFVVRAVGKALARLNHGIINIEVTVVLLMLLDPVDHPFRFGRKIGVFLAREDVRRALDPFRNVGIPEDMGEL